jgi:hypothetical protein
MTAFLLSIVFFLLALGKVGKISSGPIEVNDLLLIQLVLPAVIAYFAYDSHNLLVRQVDLRDMYFSALAVVYPNITSNRLELFLAPGASSLIGAYPLDAPSGRIRRRVLQLFGNVLQQVFIFSVLLFQLVAFQLNLDKFGSLNSANRIAFFISEIATAMLIIYSGFVLLASPTRERSIELARLD